MGTTLRRIWLLGGVCLAAGLLVLGWMIFRGDGQRTMGRVDDAVVAAKSPAGSLGLGEGTDISAIGTTVNINRERPRLDTADGDGEWMPGPIEQYPKTFNDALKANTDLKEAFRSDEQYPKYHTSWAYRLELYHRLSDCLGGANIGSGKIFVKLYFEQNRGELEHESSRKITEVIPFDDGDTGAEWVVTGTTVEILTSTLEPKATEFVTACLNESHTGYSLRQSYVPLPHGFVHPTSIRFPLNRNFVFRTIDTGQTRFPPPESGQ